MSSDAVIKRLEERIEQVEKENQALKNNFSEAKESIGKLMKVNAGYINAKNDYDTHIQESNQKIKNLTDAISSVKTIVETQAQEGGVGGSSINPKEVKEMIIANIPYQQIGTYLQKQLSIMGVETKKDRESNNKKKKGDGGKKVVKFLFIILLFGAAAAGAYKVFLFNKMVTYEIKAGAQYQDEKGNKFRLTETSKFSGTIKEIKTKNGVVKKFYAKKIIGSEEHTLVFVLSK